MSQITASEKWAITIELPELSGSAAQVEAAASIREAAYRDFAHHTDTNVKTSPKPGQVEECRARLQAGASKRVSAAWWLDTWRRCGGGRVLVLEACKGAPL